MKFKKTFAMSLAAMMAVTGLAGCGEKKEDEAKKDGKVSITVGNWPDDTDQAALELKEGLAAGFMEKNPDIELKGDTYKYDTKTFMMKASGKQLPTMYNTWFTEIDKIIKAGYAADITEQMNAHNFAQTINPDLLKLVTDENGKIYGIPTDAYVRGLYINLDLFKKAGLVDESGKPKVPQTYQELAEVSQIIKEKTGQAGFAISTTNNCGGWDFMNIAWSYGVDFMEEENGKWKATFNTPECVNAFQYVHDLKWKYNALPDNKVIDQGEGMKMFATGQAAMIINNPPSGKLVTQYGMNKDDIYVASLPAGEHGRFSQIGGNLHMFAQDATPEEIDAAMKWLEFTGFSPVLTQEQKDNKVKEYMKILDDGGIILGREAYDVWVNEDRLKAVEELVKDYTNVKPENYEDYYAFKDVTIKPEEPMCAQELYAIIDGCIQEILTNENVDIKALVENAANDFQTNHLDKANG